ncbi:hypothetical protein E4K67_23395 [Desulfosporosinus fructosivorans]|uniref:Uncharacterized protein n=1 Tax=Desulfosporosinus fructosivorans TaxID=2018669 RepID=A0A4Z0QZ33_9FIRM|nr:hypothetical protein [Desulfosporosinus fructosivorans]TGE35714.1 hypothetical protein E4K67_23395 [Desulfosporosinus fructosivorans]
MNEEIKKTKAIALSDEETEKASGGYGLDHNEYAYLTCPHCHKEAKYCVGGLNRLLYCKCGGSFVWYYDLWIKQK